MSARRAICALDLATRTGYAIGPPDARPPRSGSFRLKQPSEPVETALLNLFRFIEAEFRSELPALVIKEAMLAVAALISLNAGAAANILLQAKLHGTVELACRLFGVPCISVADSTIRKHLLGRGKLGDRRATKAAVVARCKLIGLIPRDARDDDDRADACAAFEYACAHHARRAPAELYMFNEVPA